MVIAKPSLQFEEDPNCGLATFFLIQPRREGSMERDEDRENDRDEDEDRDNDLPRLGTYVALAPYANSRSLSAQVIAARFSRGSVCPPRFDILQHAVLPPVDRGMPLLAWSKCVRYPEILSDPLR